MNLQSCRSYRNFWRRRAWALVAAASFTPMAWADEPRVLTSAQLAPNRMSAVSPEWAVETLRNNSTSATGARMQAVGILATADWQADSRCEDALVRALRSDPCDSVRVHVASVFTNAKFLTPKAHDALQNSVVGSLRDGFPGERCAAVKWQSGQALQRHPTSADPSEITSRQLETARSTGTLAITGTAASGQQGGSEESSPPERPSGIVQAGVIIPSASLGRPLPTDVPIATCNCATTDGPVQETKVTNLKSLIKWLTPARKTQPQTTIIVVNSTSAPATVPIAQSVATVQPAGRLHPVASTSGSSPTTAIPVALDRGLPASEKAAPQPLVITPQDNAVTLKERRSDLRQMGLQDPTMKMFTEQVGANPPPATSESSGLFRRLFGASKITP
jgi:hypothetical protein